MMDSTLQLTVSCGRVVLKQFVEDRDFLCEQRQGAQLHRLETWQGVRQHVRARRVVIDQMPHRSQNKRTMAFFEVDGLVAVG